MKTLLTLFLFIAGTGLQAQVTINGRVTDTRGNSLSGVSVLIKDTYDGATADSAGNFQLVTSEKGSQVLEATLSGYGPFMKQIELKESNLTVNIAIKELITELKAVIISAGTFEASDQKRVTVLNSIDIVTTASANADITAAINTLPGTQQVGDQEGLFVRGGTATESKSFIDGTLVNNFYYSSEPGIAQRGRFNPFLFKGTVFSSGGYSSLYGQALSSALILESIDLPERSSAQLSVSYLSVGGGLQHLSKNKTFSWGATYNYTDLNLAFALVKQRQDYFKIPVIHNGDVNFRMKTNGGMIKYYGVLGSTRAGFRFTDIDSAGLKNGFALKNTNIYHNLNWRQSVKGFKVISGLSFSNNKDNITGQLLDENNNQLFLNNQPEQAGKNFLLKNNGDYFNAKLVVEKKLKALSAVRGGAEYNYSKDKTDFTLFDGTLIPEKITEKLVSVFAESDIYLTNNIAIKTGLRTEHSAMLDRWNIAPRVALAYKLQGNTQLSFAYGIFYQNPERKYLPLVAKLTFAQASHYILQYQKLSSSRTFRTEIFYKEYSKLYKTSSYFGRQLVSNNNGHGYAKGLEVFWRDKKTIKNLDYWLSYSYLDTKRDFLNYPTLVKPYFAADHTASLVVKKFVSNLKSMFNASYTYASGRPYYNFKENTNTGKTFIADEGKTKGFNSMSVSINYLPNIAKKGANKFSVFVFSVTNVLGANNIYGYNYSADGQTKKAILPPSKRFFFLGCFLSFGIDRTDDAINNNL